MNDDQFFASAALSSSAFDSHRLSTKEFEPCSSAHKSKVLDNDFVLKLSHMLTQHVANVKIWSSFI